MPCRREEEDEDDEAAAAGEDDDEGEGEEEESFLVLQQSVTVGGSGDVDRLVAQIGEALQLDPAHGSRPAPREPLARKQPPPPQPLQPPVLQLLLPPGPAPASLQPSGPLQCPGNGAGAALSWANDVGAVAPLPSRVQSSPCVPGGAPGRSSTSAPHICKRGLPQPLAGPCRRTWLRGAAASRRLQQQHHHQHPQYRYRGQPGLRAGEDDPHQLLQQLVLSGNLIKEAVRRLHSRRPRLYLGARAPLPQEPSPPPPLPLAVQEDEAEGTLSPCSPQRPACSNPQVLRSQLLHKLADGILIPGS
ncbi:proto-oncogene FRAT1 [Sarcophilus harrisii]|uniref:FRAT regulator of WNT signaling pathway 1 n=1 Tax=Sarcophilus harrisii TaxID=9305 RepID=A0A7N4PHY5_SARHA|nr:proto-oncogene FRAT1 [Sarcophilus harrisii]